MVEASCASVFSSEVIPFLGGRVRTGGLRVKCREVCSSPFRLGSKVKGFGYDCFVVCRFIEPCKDSDPFNDTVKDTNRKMKKYLSDTAVINPNIPLPNLINIAQRYV